MKLSLVFVLLAALPAFGFEPCATRMKDAAKAYYANEVGATPSQIQVLNFKMGAWTEMVGNNSGSGSVTVAFNRMRGETFTVSAKQIGTSSDCLVTRIQEANENE